jgi:hypothetical protein
MDGWINEVLRLLSQDIDGTTMIQVFFYLSAADLELVLQTFSQGSISSRSEITRTRFSSSFDFLAISQK